VGDVAGTESESYLIAAERELMEETGFRAGYLQIVAEGPISPGLSTETIVLILGTALEKKEKGGGDDTERITVHAVPFNRVEAFLNLMKAQGRMIDPKVYSGLFFIRQEADATSHKSWPGRRT